MLPLLFSLHQHVPCTTIVCQTSLSSDASLISQAAPPVYQSPITITQGGTYSGNWQSLDQNVPAVTIQTSQPVVIQNSNLRGPGNLIYARYDVGAVKLTVRNTYAHGTNTNIAAQGRFLAIDFPNKIVVENCNLENTGGMYLHGYQGDGSVNQSVRMRFNRVHNIRGKGALASLVDVRHVAGIEIAWNEVINEPYNSDLGSITNMYDSSGTSSSPIRIHDNYVQGAYALDPINGSISDGGFLLGDGTTSADLDAATAFVEAYNNQITSGQSYGIAIAAGHDNNFHDNRIVFSETLPNGTPLNSPNIGAYIWDLYHNIPLGTFYNNYAYNNVIGVSKPSAARVDTWFPNCAIGKCTNNISLPDPITLDTENAEFQSWQNKVAGNNVVIGPQ